MKTRIYNNINLDFTFENLCTYLELFWLDEVKGLKYSKIWLTIIVYNKNWSFKLINSLPFNTLDFTDIFIVLKETFKHELLRNVSTMDDIAFKFYTEKPLRYNINKIIIFVLYLVFILSILILLVIILIVYLEIFDIYI